MDKEVRNLETEFRTNPETRTIEGYALKFESESKNLGGFVEVISRGALDGVLKISDVVCVFNHNGESIPLARSKNGKGSLTLEIDDVGLMYRFEAPNTANGNELLEAIKRGDIDSSSFAFTVNKSDTEISKRSDGLLLRRINKFNKIIDVSPVTRPAYEATSVSCRSIEEFRENEENELRLLEEKRKQELDKYFNELIDIINNL